MSTSKTATAAAKAVEKSQSKGKVERTPEQVIADIRRNLEVRLAVPPEDQRALLLQYDRAAGCVAGLQDAVDVFESQIAAMKATNEELMAINVDLTAKNEEFRAVYEQENRQATLQVDVLDPRVTDVMSDPPVTAPASAFVAAARIRDAE